MSVCGVADRDCTKDEGPGGEMLKGLLAVAVVVELDVDALLSAGFLFFLKFGSGAART